MRIAEFMRERGWRAFPFQERAWELSAAGISGLVHAPTGMGKTLAALGGVLDGPGGAWRVVWLTPLKALAADTVGNLRDAAAPWTVEIRTGDSTAAAKRRQRTRLPEILVTTPESLHLLLTHPETREQAAGLRLIVVDEWHEFLSTKRGLQVELALARLRSFAPGVATWGLTATIGNLDQALAALVPDGRGVLVAAPPRPPPDLELLLPAADVRFPWAGHLGAVQAPAVVGLIARARSTLVFTSTRAQAERWFQLLLRQRPDWVDVLAVHHGSLDRGLRADVERRLSAGELRAVVCTSALDLGIDLAPVEQVLQIGCPNSVARLLQRAGRSNHHPGGTPVIVCVPTHALEVLELEALRSLAADGYVEPRLPLAGALDVLCQWLVTIALGDDGFDPVTALAEVRRTRAYADLDDTAWAWCLAFVATGGALLARYPQHLRLVEREGRWHAASRAIAARHRLAIGTIVGDDQVLVRFAGGGYLGMVEEGFIAGIPAGGSFTFAGRRLQLRGVRNGVAEVRLAKTGGRAPAAVWNGTRLPWSPLLGERCRELLERAVVPWLAPLIERQRQVSAVPAAGRTVIEVIAARDEHRAILHPFAGRVVHDGLGALLALRLTRAMPCTVTHASTEVSVGLHSSQPLPTDAATWRRLLDPAEAAADLREAAGAGLLARTRFRGVARVSGLTFSGPPGDDRRRRQTRISAELLHDVFVEHDPGNLLLAQARAEAWEALAGERIAVVLAGLARDELDLRPLSELSPFAFPVWAEFIRGRTTSEAWEERVRKMAIRLERHG